MKPSLLSLVLALVLGACSTPSRKDFSADWGIHEGAVHPARIGGRISDVQGRLGPDYTVHPEGSEWVVSTREGIELYRLIPRTSAPDRIATIKVTNRNFRTPQGIGPNLTIDEVSKVLGSPVFVRRADSTLERVIFPRQPGRGMLLQLSAPGTELIGDYVGVKPSMDGLLRTRTWREGARVSAVLVGPR